MKDALRLVSAAVDPSDWAVLFSGAETLAALIPTYDAYTRLNLPVLLSNPWANVPTVYSRRT